MKGYQYHTSHSYSHNPGGHDRLLSLSVSSCPVHENVHGDERLGYGGHGADKGGISDDDVDGRQNTSCYYGDKRIDKSVDDGRHEYSCKETIHSYSCNIVETFDGNCRCGYRSHTRHSSSHNPVDDIILLSINLGYCCVDNSLHENIRGDRRGDDGRSGSMSQDIRHYFFRNIEESVDGDVRSEYRSHNSPPLPVIHVILVYCWGFIFMVMREVYIGLKPVNVIHITMAYYTLSTQGSLKKQSQIVFKEKSTSKSCLLFLYKHATTLSSKHNTTSLPIHATTSNLILSIYHFYSYVCNLYSCKPPSYTILESFV